VGTRTAVLRKDKSLSIPENVASPMSPCDPGWPTTDHIRIAVVDSFVMEWRGRHALD
jgi:hypothetical protein